MGSAPSLQRALQPGPTGLHPDTVRAVAAAQDEWDLRGRWTRRTIGTALRDIRSARARSDIGLEQPGGDRGITPETLGRALALGHLDLEDLLSYRGRIRVGTPEDDARMRACVR